MATLFLDTTHQERDPSREATLKVLLSPIRGADGQWRVCTQALPVGENLGDVLPPQTTWDRLICNGRVLEPHEQDTYQLQPGDEVLAIPQWGALPVAPLVMLAIGLAVSIATTALSYLLFPPAKPNIQQGVDEPTFSFAGIQTTIGPGQVVPVIYGRHRVGGQLLSANVVQAMTVIDTQGPGGRQQVEALSAPPTLTMLLALGEGPVANIVLDSLELNGQPGVNFPDLQAFTRPGTADQTPMPEFGEVANTFSDGHLIPGDPGITYTTTVPVQAFTLNIAFQEGLYYLTEKGQKEDNMTTVQYRYRIAAGTYSDWGTFDVAAARTSVVRFAIRREGLTLGIYDIQLRFAGARNTNELRAKWNATLDSVTEIVGNTQAYPNTALLGLRAVATDALQGALPNVTIEVFGRTVRVDSFAGPEVYSDNPAWCVLDLMTHRRYGLGYPDAVMDLAAFGAWAAYCDQVIDDEPRHRLNYVLDREMRAQPLLMELAGSARTILLKSEGLWTPRVTRDETPVQLLSWTNVRNLVITYTRDPDRINVMEGRFINEEQGYESDVQTWPAVQDWPAEVRKASLDLRGITKPSRVQRALQFELNRRRFEVLSLEMDCAPDALVLQVHDIFRFSHPLPGWGYSGRIQPTSTAQTLVLDTPVTFEAGQSYHVYVRYQTDSMELRPVVNPGPGQAMVLTLNPALSFTPVAYESLWAFGRSSPVDAAQRPFRVVRMGRNADNTVHLQAIAHNPTLYDEPTASLLPDITTIFNPLGPSPPLTSLVLLEVTRVEPNGTSLRVVNVSWDVAPLSRTYAPYGGALIQRRTVLTSATGGLGEAGTQALGGALESGGGNYLPITQVSGHVLDFDDYTVIIGTTYQYRVIPVSQRGVPNNAGAREGQITVTGPTTPDYFPGTPFNLRLKGKTPQDTLFEGPNVELQWDPPTGLLFSETFYIQDYIMDVWAPGQPYRLRTTTIPARTAGETLNWTYFLNHNTEDQLAAGQIGARRDLQFFVWARTNTNRVSLTPGQLLVYNPPPDMSVIIPEVAVIAGGAIISFDQWAEPRDFDHYEVYLDTVNPPLARYEDVVALGFAGPGNSRRKIVPQGLTTGQTYYVYILPYDTFGPGLPTQIVSFVAGGIDPDTIDSTPPALPTGLTLTTGTVVSADGTIQPWVQASWNLNTESDVARYTVYFYVGTSSIPTPLTVNHPSNSLRLENVPGHVVVSAILYAADAFDNLSPITAPVSIVTAGDLVPPGVPLNPEVRGSFRAVIVQWIPPGDLDYLATEVWGSSTNTIVNAIYLGEGASTFVHGGLISGVTIWYWVRAKDTSGNYSPFVPGPLEGMQATTIQTTGGDYGPGTITETTIAPESISTPLLRAGSVTANIVTTNEVITLGAQIRNAIIEDAHITTLSANKITTGILDVLVGLGVSGSIFLDGLNNLIIVYDDQPVTPRVARVVLGKLGTLNTQYGLQLFNDQRQLMWNFATGATPAGIEDGAINANKISAGAIAATHLRADQVIITTSLQLPQGALAIINDAHITNLTANKIQTGTLQFLFAVGHGFTGRPNVFLDGLNHNITIWDDQTPDQRARVWLGKTGSGPQFVDYGLILWDPAGNPMWHFDTGATTFGITNAAITSAKIGTAQITTAHIQDAAIVSAKIGDLQVENAKIANLTVGTSKIATDAVSVAINYVGGTPVTTTVTEANAAILTFPELQAGDQVILWAGGTAVVPTGLNQIRLRIRENSLVGAQLATVYVGSGMVGPVFMQAVYTVTTALIDKIFVFTFQNEAGTDLVTLEHVYFTSLRRKK